MTATAKAKTKFSSRNLNTVYKAPMTKASEQTGAYHSSNRMLVLGKTTSGRTMASKAIAVAAPTPINTPSLRKEHQGQDVHVNLVPSGRTGWGNTANSNADKTQEPQNHAAFNAAASTASNASSNVWGGGVSGEPAPSLTTAFGHVGNGTTVSSGRWGDDAVEQDFVESDLLRAIQKDREFPELGDGVEETASPTSHPEDDGASHAPPAHRRLRSRADSFEASSRYSQDPRGFEFALDDRSAFPEDRYYGNAPYHPHHQRSQSSGGFNRFPSSQSYANGNYEGVYPSNNNNYSRYDHRYEQRYDHHDGYNRGYAHENAAFYRRSYHPDGYFDGYGYNNNNSHGRSGSYGFDRREYAGPQEQAPHRRLYGNEPEDDGAAWKNPETNAWRMKKEAVESPSTTADSASMTNDSDSNQSQDTQQRLPSPATKDSNAHVRILKRTGPRMLFDPKSGTMVNVDEPKADRRSQALRMTKETASNSAIQVLESPNGKLSNQEEEPAAQNDVLVDPEDNNADQIMTEREKVQQSPEDQNQTPEDEEEKEADAIEETTERPTKPPRVRKRPSAKKKAELRANRILLNKKAKTVRLVYKPVATEPAIKRSYKEVVVSTILTPAVTEKSEKEGECAQKNASKPLEHQVNRSTNTTQRERSQTTQTNEKPERQIRAARPRKITTDDCLETNEPRRHTQEAKGPMERHNGRTTRVRGRSTIQDGEREESSKIPSRRKNASEKRTRVRVSLKTEGTRESKSNRVEQCPSNSIPKEQSIEGNKSTGDSKPEAAAPMVDEKEMRTKQVRTKKSRDASERRMYPRRSVRSDQAEAQTTVELKHEVHENGAPSGKKPAVRRSKPIKPTDQRPVASRQHARPKSATTRPAEATNTTNATPKPTTVRKIRSERSLDASDDKKSRKPAKKPKQPTSLPKPKQDKSPNPKLSSRQQSTPAPATKVLKKVYVVKAVHSSAA